MLNLFRLRTGRNIDRKFKSFLNANASAGRAQFSSNTGDNIRKSGSIVTSLIEQNKNITWYSCGPTVYDSAHLGHARTYVSTDIIRRILTDHFNFRLDYALGITDIDDKIIQKGVSLGYTNTEQFLSLARDLEQEFFKDMNELNVLPPNAVLRVTEHVPEILAFIQTLLEKGNAYITPTGVYFHVDSFKREYDRFNRAPKRPAPGIPIHPDLLDGDSPEDFSGTGKRDVRDFALWKLQGQSGAGSEAVGPVWESPWGAGRPGWHIECSAMTHSYFGRFLDIHSGGVDLQFPHHTNEIAQCESHHFCEHEKDNWVRHWLHMGHLHIEGRKMSKSLKNFITIREFLGSSNSRFPADDFRIFCLQHQYHANLSFSADRMEEARENRLKFNNFFSLIEQMIKTENSQNQSFNKKPTKQSVDLTKKLLETQNKVELALENFDTPAVLTELGSLVSSGSEYGTAKKNTVTDKNENTNYPIEPLISVGVYIRNMLGLFGLKFSSRYHLQLDIGSPEKGKVVNDANDETLDLLVGFREKVRDFNIRKLKELKKTKKSRELDPTETQLYVEVQEALVLCDQVRDQLKNKFHIRVFDDKLGSGWTRGD